jgi:hypothetical protein
MTAREWGIGSFQFRSPRVGRGWRWQRVQFSLKLSQRLSLACTQCNASCHRRTHGTNHAEIRRVSYTTEAGLHPFELLQSGQLPLGQVGELHLVEKQVQEFLLIDLEDELIHAFAGVARFAGAGATTPALGALEAVANGVFLVPGENMGIASAGAVVKGGLASIPRGDGDFLALVAVEDSAAAQFFTHGLLYLRPVAPQEPLSVYSAFLLRVFAPIDQERHTSLPVSTPP